jgi:hypothetical protein
MAQGFTGSSSVAVTNAITQARGDNSTKIATTAYADAGLDLIATASPSGVAAVDFTSIPQTYRSLVLFWNGITHDQVTAAVRLSSDAGAGLAVQTHIYTQIAGTTVTAPGEFTTMFTAVNQLLAQAATGHMIIPNYQSGPMKSYSGRNMAAHTVGDINSGTHTTFWGVIDNAAGVPATGSLVGLRLWLSAGLLTGGTIALYGVK